MVSRGALSAYLAEGLSKATNVKWMREATFQRVQSSSAVLQNGSGKNENLDVDLIIGADGRESKVRKQRGFDETRFDVDDYSDSKTAIIEMGKLPSILRDAVESKRWINMKGDRGLSAMWCPYDSTN